MSLVKTTSLGLIYLGLIATTTWICYITAPAVSAQTELPSPSSLACIDSEIGAVAFQYRWGTEGTWSDDQIATAGKWTLVQSAQTDKRVAQQLQIKLDTDNTGSIRWAIFNLDTTIVDASDCSKAKKYSLYLLGSDIHLKEITKDSTEVRGVDVPVK